HRLRPQPLALVEARVGPNMHEPRHRPGDAVHRREQRGDGAAAGHRAPPQLDRLGEPVQLERVGAHFADRAISARVDRRHEMERKETYMSMVMRTMNWARPNGFFDCSIAARRATSRASSSQEGMSRI